jgi:pyruvate,water dikinase
MTARWVAEPSDPSTVWTREWVGGKAANLHVLARIGATTPALLAVTTDAFRSAFGASPADPALQNGATTVDDVPRLSAALRARVLETPLPEPVAAAVRQAITRSLPGVELFAVRSSAADEDSADQSFAGLHDSFLYVRGVDEVLDRIRQVWASAYHERALAYRLKHGVPLDRIAVGVVIQPMIEPAASGVLFTCNPANDGVHETVVSAVYGLGEGLVSGALPADTYTINKRSLEIESDIVDKAEQFVFDRAHGRGVTTAPVPAERVKQPALSDAQLRELATAASRVERHFGRPQDIEFAFDAAGKLHLLQSRAVTQTAEYGPAAGNRLIWDNSNIIESYSGVTSPMTFSFIRHAYTIVYHCFSEVMGISKQKVRDHQPVFENMLGLFRGRVYYNLRNWYYLIRLFPGFQYNRRAMESMMGLREPLDLEETEPEVSFFRKWFVELPALVRLMVRSLWNFRRIQPRVDAFQADFKARYDAWTAMDFSALKPHEMLAVYREMEARLLWNWKAPIINDFYVMIYYGLLKKLCGKWCDDTGGSLQNDLICGEGGVESAEPAKMLLRLASQAQAVPRLRDLILHGKLETLPAAVAADPQFADFNAVMREYLDRFGFRCPDELKLEEFSFRDRPHLVYGVLRNYLQLDDPAALDVGAMEAREQTVRRTAEEKAAAALAKKRGLVPRRFLFNFVLRNARRGVKNRENMRFARTRIYGLLRHLLRALGAKFVEEGVLDEREDVFYLTIDEVWDFIQGTAVTTNLRGLVAIRRAEFAGYRDPATPLPDDRFETFGPAYHKNRFKNHKARAPVFVDGALKGIGCCPGVVAGEVKVVHHPSEAGDLAKRILVAERTDPGWVPLYPAVSGLLIERGSILSHSAVVAREMGIPTIVGITGLLVSIPDGSRIEMDGQAGTVRLLDQPSGHGEPEGDEGMKG